MTGAGILRCPRTGRALEQVGDSLQTLDGAIRYPIAHGVPNFRLHPPSDPADEREIEAMADAAAQVGWRQALQQHRPNLLSYVDDADRGRFLDLLPIEAKSVVLEIGPGLAQFLVPLGRRAAQVHGLELSPSQAHFAAERCREEGVANVAIAAGGDDLLLPYADACFDVVVLNNVLEWMRPTDAPRVTSATQGLALTEAHRVLKPGGVFFIATKNRWSLRLLLGGRDENARNVRFGHALPRPLTRALAAERPGILGLLHSHRALEGMLRDAGFEPEASYWSGPNGRYPKWFIASDAESVRAARRQPGFVQGETRSTRLLMPLVPAPLVRHVMPWLAFVTRKRAA